MSVRLLPILFKAEMVRAILAGQKTVTRRVIKPQPEFGVGRYAQDGAPGEIDWVLLDKDGDAIDSQLRCPYGKPGDELYVRETARAEELKCGQDGVRYAADDAFVPIENTRQAGDDWLKMHNYAGRKGAWVPSILTPRWASRIRLTVTEVRVERVQDISAEDAFAEGVDTYREGAPTGAFGEYRVTPKRAFEQLWRSINDASKGCAWDLNPWVWCVRFERKDGAT